MTLSCLRDSVGIFSVLTFAGGDGSGLVCTFCPVFEYKGGNWEVPYLIRDTDYVAVRRLGRTKPVPSQGM